MAEEIGMKYTKVIAGLLIAVATVLPVAGQNLLTPILTAPAPNNSGAAQDYIQFNENGQNSYPGANLICFSAGCGGEFEAQINTGMASGSPQIPVTVWCSDYQLNVTTGSQY